MGVIEPDKNFHLINFEYPTKYIISCMYVHYRMNLHLHPSSLCSRDGDFDAFLPLSQVFLVLSRCRIFLLPCL